MSKSPGVRTSEIRTRWAHFETATAGQAGGFQTSTNPGLRLPGLGSFVFRSFFAICPAGSGALAAAAAKIAKNERTANEKRTKNERKTKNLVY